MSIPIPFGKRALTTRALRCEEYEALAKITEDCGTYATVVKPVEFSRSLVAAVSEPEAMCWLDPEQLAQINGWGTTVVVGIHANQHVAITFLSKAYEHGLPRHVYRSVLKDNSTCLDDIRNTFLTSQAIYEHVARRVRFT